MVIFLFEVVIALLIAGLLLYLARWAVAAFGLPQPILVVLSCLVLIVLIYWLWQAFPGLPAPAHPVRR